MSSIDKNISSKIGGPWHANSFNRYVRKAHKLKIRQLCQLVHELNSYRAALETQSETLISSQKQLAASEHKYHVFFDLAPFSYMIMSRIGLVEEVNRAFINMMVCPRDELINSPFLQFTSPESSDIFNDHVRKVLKRKTGHTCSLKLINGKKESLHVQLATVYSKRKESKSVHLLSSLMDLTKQRQAEHSLTQYCGRLEDMVKKSTSELHALRKKWRRL